MEITKMSDLTIIKYDEVAFQKTVKYWYCSMRFVIAIFGFFAFFNMIAMRASLSFGIVCMTKPIENNDNNSLIENSTLMKSNKTNTISHLCDWSEKKSKNLNDTNNKSESIVVVKGEFKWSKKVQGFIHSSFFWGYCLSQIPGGLMADMFGGKRVITIGFSLGIFMTLLVPVSARFSYKALMFIRFCSGLGLGVTYPSMHAIWAKWAPPAERSTLSSISFAGSVFGIVVLNPISSKLCTFNVDNGWPLIFYCFGIVSLVWLILWLIIVSDSPTQSKRLSAAEHDYIVYSLKNYVDYGHIRINDIFIVPWRKFFTSLAFWAIIVTNVSVDWGLYSLETNIPTYLNDVLRLDLNSNGFVSIIPYLLFWLMILSSGFLADKVRTYISTKNTRKIFNTSSQFITGICLLSISFLDCRHWLAVVILLTIGTGAVGLAFSGFVLNHVDIAPKYAGVLMGFSNSLSALISGIGAPYVIGVLTKTGTAAEWKNVFYVAFTVLSLGSIFYLIFAQGSVQDWALVRRESVFTVDALENEKMESELKVVANDDADDDGSGNLIRDSRKHSLTDQ